MFQKTVRQLTSVYLAIIMTISLSFSAALYHTTIGQLEHEYDRQAELLQSRFPGFDSVRQYLSDRDEQIDSARLQVVSELVFTNSLVLGLGGLASYYLARRTLRPIEEAHEAQSRFTADASHELRTPLTVMRTEIEVALMDPGLTLDDARSQLRSNLEELTRLSSLSEGLLRLAQLDAQPLPKSQVRASEIVEQAVGAVRAIADKKAITIKTVAPHDLMIDCDEASLVEGLTILLDNAIKYSSQKTTVTLTVHKQGRSILISVRDHGQGIAADKLPHIFDRFYRADDARTSGSDQGYGLGLAIAQHIIALHSGELSVVSKQGKGTTFTMQLPH